MSDAVLDRAELTSFALAAHADLDRCGELADWLEERDDPRGRLLRLRWKRWRTERERGRLGDQSDERRITRPFGDVLERLHAAGVSVSGSVTAVVTWRREAADDRMRGYLMERFAGVFGPPRA